MQGSPPNTRLHQPFFTVPHRHGAAYSTGHRNTGKFACKCIRALQAALAAHSTLARPSILTIKGIVVPGVVPARLELKWCNVLSTPGNPEYTDEYTI